MKQNVVEINKKDMLYCLEIAATSFNTNWNLKSYRKKGNQVMYDLRDVFRFLKEKLTKSSKSSNLTAARVKWIDNRNRLLELEIKEREKVLIPEKEVVEEMTKMVMNCRAKMLNLSSKIAPNITGNMTIKKREKIIRDYVHECLDELAKYDPTKTSKKKSRRKKSIKKKAVKKK